ncbi:MAG: glycoside hydrolase family 2 protein, partial [Muribaculaceae bacterium]|nr:glycoside hydrolase family 2 protein [Muribaculaceae bacterium]
MRHNWLRAIAFAAAAIMVLNADGAVSRRELNDGWKFRQGRAEIWYPATVPGTVHTDLMDNEIIEDPFFRLNERGVQWVDKEDWMYETSLTATPEELAAANQELVFHGLDTYADVYLNGQPILNADNMHRTWRVNIKDKLQPGDNKLEVYFHSPIKIDLPKCDLYDYGFNTGPDQSQNGGIFDKLVSIFARKAGYHYGWDWGPRLVTSGIWRPIVLETWNGPKINNVQVIQNEVDASKADLTLIAEIIADNDDEAARLDFTADGKPLASKEVSLKKGLNRIEVPAKVKKPRLWWPNGLGEPYLYDLTTTVTTDGATDSDSQEIGLRSIKLHNDKDQYGHNLYFEVNGKPVFMKGVDMVPLDNFLPRITREKYEKHVLDAKNVNMNMIRVWGGGVYEDDYFYQLCDRNGILVWQDFMFACSTYPADEKFLASIRSEAIDNVRRLRNHACIALWCGNNECQDVFYGWGNRKQYYEEKGVLPLLESQFKAMYFKTLPEVVKEHGGGTAYRPSSPFAFEDTPSDGINGDDHYWGVWHGRDSIGHYNVKRARFFSEYGFQSFPEFESVKLYAPQERDWDINSEVMMAHQRAGSYANNLIREYMADEFRVPGNFEDFLYVGMILQGDAIKTAMEAHRRDMPYCMGTLVWQHNDCWPVASWAGRDYYGRWKAQQYFARNAYRDILVSPLVKGDTLSVHLVSDRRNAVKGTFALKAMTLDGKVIWQKEFKTTARPLESREIFTSDIRPILGDRKRGQVIFSTTFTTGDAEPYTNIAYACRQKYME